MGTAKPAAARSLPSILESLVAAIPDLRCRFKVARLGVFGSYASGHERTGSDLDVLVEFASKWGYHDLFGLQEELTALLHLKVDVVPRETLKPYVGKRILADVVWLDEPDGRKALATIRERPISPRPEREIRDFLHDILENIDVVNDFLGNGDFDRLVSDRQFRYAFCTRSSSSAKRLPIFLHRSEGSILRFRGRRSSLSAMSLGTTITGCAWRRSGTSPRPSWSRFEQS